jgi:tetratricopeptide (TPR) repeat protein
MKFKFWQKEGKTPQFFSAEDSVVDSSEYIYNQESGINYEEPQTVQEPVEVKETAYKKASRWIVLIGVALLPVFFLPWSTSILEFNKQMLLLVLAGASLILWLLHVVVSGQLSWRVNPLDKGIVAFLLAVSLSTIFSLARFKSLFGLTGSLSDSLVAVITLSIFYFGIVNLFDDKGDKVRTILGHSLFVVLLYGVLNMFGIYLIRFPFAMSKAFNTIGSVNALGMIAAIALPLLYKSNLSMFKYLNIGKIGTILALAVLVILNWWVLWAVAIAGMATMIALDSLNNPGLKISKFLLPMTVIVLGVFLMVVNFNFSFLKKDLPVEAAPAFGLSANIAESVLKKNIAFGYGPENFSLAFDQYGAGNLTNTTLSSAKFFDSVSQVFNWAVQGGVVVLAAFAFLLWLLIRGMFKGELTKEDVGVLSSVVSLVVGMFLYPFNLTLMFVAFVMMGLMAVSLWRDGKRLFNVEERASTSLISSLGFIGGLILVLVGTYFGATLYISDVKYAKALSSQDINKAASLLSEAINWNGQSDTYYRTASQAALGLLSQELNKKADAKDTQQTARIQNYMSSAINFAKTATDLGPRESLNWNNLGNVYQNLLGLVGGVDALSAGAYQKAADLRPGDPSFYNQIGNLYLAETQLLRQAAASGNQNAAQLNQQASVALTAAETNFKKAVDMSDNFGLAIYNLGVVYDQEGKLPEAIKQLEKIAPYNSDQPNLLFELGLLYYRNGNKDKAFNTLQQVLVLQSSYSNALWYLALIYEERKDIPNAIAQLQKILAIDANKDNQVVLTKLDELQNGKKTIPPKKVLDQKPI